MKIAKIHAREILDSRGNPTIETDVILENNVLGRASVPSGASVGTNEAIELRDNDPKKYLGQGVLKAVDNVNNVIAKNIEGLDTQNQELIDNKLINLDGTENKRKLGANAILSVSLSCAHAAAINNKIPLFKHIGNIAGNNDFVLPIPLMNIVNGGKHADFSSDIQEFMIMPIGTKTFSDALRMGSEIFHTLQKILSKNGYQTTVGDEGGFAPHFKKGNKEALDVISEAVKSAGYNFGEDVVCALDVAASQIYENEKYNLKTENKIFTTEGMIAWLQDTARRYPIVSIEDGLFENDWDGWVKMTKSFNGKIQIVGDDILVTNPKFLKRAIEKKAGNAILIKLNQIGTLTETIQVVKMAKEAGWNTIISHRSGETEDTTIAHLAVGLSTGQIKTGSVSRTERIAKYNELLRIEEELSDKATYARFKIPEPKL